MIYENGPESATDSGTATYTNHLPPRVRRGSDFLRALRYRRRVSRALDDLCGVVRAEVDLTEGDYWHDTLMDRGWVERDRAGRALLEAA